MSHLVKYCLRRFLKLESDVAPFNALGNLLKRTEPMPGSFSKLNLGAGVSEDRFSQF